MFYILYILVFGFGAGIYLRYKNFKRKKLEEKGIFCETDEDWLNY